MPKHFSEPEKERIRARLLERGEQLFSTYGLAHTNVEELARAAGISKGAFYLFYPSKESLFMDVVEALEERYRGRVLTAVERPGPSPRARLAAVLAEAFHIFLETPLLQTFTSANFSALLLRMPPEKITEHLSSDRRFITQLVERCQAAGIPVSAPIEQVSGLIYALLYAHLHQADLPIPGASSSLPILTELVAAYWLGEIELHHQPEEVSHDAGH
jgi:AcrR family transcriptional regulator